MAEPRAEQADFIRQVRGALANLYDPGALRKQALAKRLVMDGPALRELLLAVIQTLKPAPEVAKTSRAWRAYDLLQLRYVEALDPMQVQQKLGLTKSPYYLEHERALSMVAAVLADKNASEAAAAAGAAAQPLQGPGEVAPPQPHIAAAHNLPLPVTSFVGREREMAEVQRLLSETRLLTLTGAGGSGKSRLALQVARASVGGYAGGIWLVELAALTRPQEVPRAIAEALGVAETPNRSAAELLVDSLRDRELLLVVDNCEHLLAPCASIVYDLLRRCERLRVLATSREALKLPGEIAWLVPTLSLPAEDSLESEATRLFVERARAASRTFEITPEVSATVGTICRRLDGIPLAIELAAARVNVLSPRQIEQRLND